MTSFAWKRKIGENVCKSLVEKFASETEESAFPDAVPREKRPKLTQVERSERLYEEGCVLAEEERYWEALKKWDEALVLDTSNEKLYELKSQAYLELQELIPALEAAEKVVELKPTWWVGYQTLGRTQMSLGEVSMAIRNFSKGCHLNPELKELWVEDLGWACSLLTELKSDENLRQKLGMTIHKIDILLKWSKSVVEHFK